MSHKEFIPLSVIECRVAVALAIDLCDLLSKRTYFCISCRMLRKDIIFSIHHERLAEISRREELHVHARLSYKLCRNRLVKMYSHRNALVLACNLDCSPEVIVRIIKDHRDCIAVLVNVSGLENRIDIPLLRCVHQTDTAACGNTHTPLDDFDRCGLLIAEHAVVFIAIHKEVHSPVLKILKIVYLERLSRQH